MILPTLTGLRALHAEESGTLRFEFRDAAGESHMVPIEPGVMNALAPTLFNIMGAVAEEGAGHADVQPATLTGARAAILHDGSPAIELRVDGVPMRVALRPAAFAGLRSILDELERLTAGPGAGDASRH